MISEPLQSYLKMKTCAQSTSVKSWLYNWEFLKLTSGNNIILIKE